MKAITTKKLSKQFGGHKAVDNLDLEIPAGSICGFLGKNGAGKTTTIKMLVGLSKPTSGSIYLMESERKFGACNNAQIGYLPDVPNFYGYMTASEYLSFCGKLYGMEEKKCKNRIIELLKRVDLYGVKTRTAGFSRGMKQRLGIAQALMNEPDVIFLDEPISALDPVGRHEVMEIIRSLRGSVTVFFSTHILSDVENVCDYILIIEKGKLLIRDTIENIKKKYSTNTAKVRLYSRDDYKTLSALVRNENNLIIEEINDMEILLRGADIKSIGKILPVMLSEAGIALESYQAYIPSLEDIFMEVTSHA
jgi:ABC-2 type transport system ATP-binding protein